MFPDEPFERGYADHVVKGDGDVAWGNVLRDLETGDAKLVYEGGKIEGEEFLAARWDLMQKDKYMWASVQTIRGCPKHCSFCSVWRTDGQKPRQRSFENVINEIIDLRRLGFRFIALADDNFYPVTLTDLRLAEQQGDQVKLDSLRATRAERYALMAELAKLPKDMVFFTQITMESAEDTDYLDAMRKANIKGALVGVEAVTPEGLKAVYKDFNYSGDRLIQQLQTFRKHGVHVLGSALSFGLPTDKESTFMATVEVAMKADVTFAQFVMMTPFPGHRRLRPLGKRAGRSLPETGRCDTPITRYWLIPTAIRPKMFTPHPIHVVGGDQGAYPGRLGSLLRVDPGLEALRLHQVPARPRRLRPCSPSSTARCTPAPASPPTAPAAARPKPPPAGSPPRPACSSSQNPCRSSPTPPGHRAPAPHRVSSSSQPSLP